MMTLPRIPRSALPVACLSLSLSLAACDRANGPQELPSAAADTNVAPPASGGAAPDASAIEPKRSIIRPDVVAAPIAAPTLDPVQVAITFPENKAQPGPEGIAQIDAMMTTPTFQAGGPITIWGHSDSQGSDSANLAASRRRAKTVEAYLESKGVSKARMTVIALGEGRPVSPNRKLDGSDDPDGRAKNRRVEIRAEPPAPPEGEDAGLPAAGAIGQTGTETP